MLLSTVLSDATDAGMDLQVVAGHTHTQGSLHFFSFDAVL